MTIIRMDDLRKKPDPPAPKRSKVVVTGPNGKPVTKTAHPLLSVDNLNLTEEAQEARKAKAAAAMDAHHETLRQRCIKSGVKVFYPRRKK